MVVCIAIVKAGKCKIIALTVIETAAALHICPKTAQMKTLFYEIYVINVNYIHGSMNHVVVTPFLNSKGAGVE